MKALLSATATVSMLALGSQAEASPPWKHERYVPARYDAYDYAKVVDVDPIVHQVRVETPRRECWDEVREVRATRYSDSHSKGGMVVGGIIGGVVGNQIGSGRGKDVATVASSMGLKL